FNVQLCTGIQEKHHGYLPICFFKFRRSETITCCKPSREQPKRTSNNSETKVRGVLAFMYVVIFSWVEHRRVTLFDWLRPLENIYLTVRVRFKLRFIPHHLHSSYPYVWGFGHYIDLLLSDDRWIAYTKTIN